VLESQLAIFVAIVLAPFSISSVTIVYMRTAAGQRPTYWSRYGYRYRGAFSAAGFGYLLMVIFFVAFIQIYPPPLFIMNDMTF